MHVNPRDVVVFGATGRVGTRLVEYALEAGHRVTAVARDATTLAALAARSGPGRIRTATADVLDPASVAAAVGDAAIVLSALAAPSLEQPGETLSRGMRNIVAALAATRPDARVLCIAGAGVLPAPGQDEAALRLELPEFPGIFRAMSREHAAAWRTLRASTLRWTVVCPPDMPSGERTGTYRTAVEDMPPGGTVISAEDVADFMVREAVEARFARVRVGIAY